MKQKSSKPLYPATDEELLIEVKQYYAALRDGNAAVAKLMLDRADQFADYEERVRRLIWKYGRPRRVRAKFASASPTNFTVGSRPYRR